MQTTLSQPVGVKKMTNVAIIRYRLNQKHFEIACYKNKAIDWRNGVEKDIGEVLQVDKVFSNASHGDEAPMSELKWYFPGMNKDQIMLTILEKGDLQMGEKERGTQNEQIYKGVVKFIQEKCVHPVNKRPFDQASIEHAITKINFIVKQDQPMKKQALACIKLLQDVFYLQRAEMKVMVTIQASDEQAFQKELISIEPTQVQQTTGGDTIRIEMVIDPSKYRPLSQILKDQFKKASVEVVDSNMANKEELDIESAGTVELELKPVKQSIEKEVSQQKFKNKAKQEQVEMERSQQQSKLQEQAIQNQAITQKNAEESKGKFKCSLCLGETFETNNEFRAHYKTDWHMHNTKLKAEGKLSIRNVDYLEHLLDEQMKM